VEAAKARGCYSLLIRGDDGALVVIDLKGEMSHLENVTREAQRAGRIFKHFTGVLGISSYIFNPIQQLNTNATSFVQFVETIIESLRLNYGDCYGRRFFSSQGRDWLLGTIKRWPNLSSFEELYAKAAPEFFKNQADMDRCREVISVLRQVSEVTAMNWKPRSGENRIVP
jgi:hypothetical protein